MEQRFSITPEQGKELDRRFSEELQHNIALYNEGITGVTFRLGLMAFKIAMVLTALRSEEDKMICSDEDFQTAMHLVLNVYMKHSISMLKKVSKDNNTLNTIEKELLKRIPINGEIKRSEIAKEANELEIKDRTLTDILKRLINLNLLIKVSHGVYTKI